VTAVVIDTARDRPGDPVAYWRDEASRLFRPLQVRTERPDAFYARSVGHDLCGLRLTRTRTGESLICGTRRTIAEFDPEAFILVVHLSGAYRVEQEERTAVCRAGDLALFDSSRPFRVESDGPVDVLTLTLPKAALGPYRSRTPSAPLRVPGDLGPATLLRSLLGDVMEGLAGGRIAPGDQAVAESVLALVRGATRPRDAGPAPPPSPLAQIKRYIDEHLGDPGLSPERIAASQFVSRRQLYTLFEGEGCGVREWIRARRLERCERDLRDPARRGETVMSVATRWGFTDASHFSACFRAAYGMPPGAYRDAVARRR